MASELWGRITARENFQRAYLDLARSFDEDAQGARYRGLDGVSLSDADTRATTILEQARQELIAHEALVPARRASIPKRGGALREVYLLTIKDRLKARAIYRVLEPLFEQRYSPFLFSYRQSHPTYYAARSVARRYERYFGRDVVLTLDLEQYTDHIDHQILTDKLRAINVPNDVITLITLFMEQCTLRNGVFQKTKVGLLQGTPLTALFANLYLNDLDHWVGPRLAFYRRVGDDLILCDRQSTTINQLERELRRELAALKLKIQNRKVHLGSSDQPFKFLGYVFHDKHISLNTGFVRQTIQEWNDRCTPRPRTLHTRLRRLKALCYLGQDSFHHQFLELLRQHPQLNDDQQVQRLSARFFRLITTYVAGSYSPRTQRLVRNRLKSLKLPSLYGYYLDLHHGRKQLKNFTLP